MDVVELDARLARRPEDLESPIAAALKCPPDDLGLDDLGDSRVRVIVDNADAFYDKSWFINLQYRWRSLFTSPAARGRAHLLILGRPNFRLISGGDASPLVNVGPTLVVRPLTADEIAAEHALSDDYARLVLRETGGHPQLAAALAELLRSAEPKNALPEFARQQEEYTMRLVADFELPARALLVEVAGLRGNPGVDRRTLVDKFYGAALNDGTAAIKDLIASGLLAAGGDHNVQLGASCLHRMPSVRLLGRRTDEFPVDPPPLQAASAGLVFEAENRLRQVAVNTFENAEPTWWTTRVPPELRGRAERAATDEEASAVDVVRLHPIAYLTLGELFELIFDRGNWDGLFAIKFSGSIEATRRRADDLKAVRNKVAHSRPVTDSDYELARLAVKFLHLDAASPTKAPSPSTT